MKKMLPNFKQFLLAVPFAMATNANAQCTITNHPPNPNTTNNNGTYDYVQSFTAPCSGDMQYFELTSTETGIFPGATLYVYNGNVSSGTAIYTQPYSDITITNPGDPITINITGSLPLTSGQQYSFRFSATTMNFHFTTGSAYAGGHAWQNGSPLTTTDFYFEIEIGNCAPTTITPDLATLPDITGDCNVTPTAPTATNDCGSVITGVSDVTFPITSTGTTQVTWTFDDGQGNSTTQVQNVNNPTIDVSVMENGTTLYAVQTGAMYQWLDCDAGDMPIIGEVNQFYDPSTTGNYSVQIEMGSCVDTSDCYLIDFTGIGELSSEGKELVKIVDLLGRETEFKPNTPLIFIYSDGTVERIVEVEQ